MENAGSFRAKAITAIVVAIGAVAACACGGSGYVAPQPSAARSSSRPSEVVSDPPKPSPTVTAKLPVAPQTWAAALLARRASLAEEIKALPPNERRLFDALRGNQSFGTLAGRTPSLGDMGKLGTVEFLTIADPRTAQFADGPRVLFVRGLDMDTLVPGQRYTLDQGVFVVADVIEFTALLGNRRRGPLLKLVDDGPAQTILNKETALKEDERRLVPISGPDIPGRAIYFRELTDANTRAIFEDEVGKPKTIDLAELDAESIEMLVPLAEGLRVIQPTDRPLLDAGHKFRPRTWSTADGKFSVEASFVSATSDHIKLRRADNGKEISIARAKLSDDDRQYVDERKYEADRIEKRTEKPVAKSGKKSK
jgi:hypothetical protein